jgi:hypothetical protein
MMRILLLAAMLTLPVSLPQEHEGQPASCDNSYDNKHKCECVRAQQECDPDDQQTEDPKCQVYCRKDACKCANRCNS